MIHNSKKIILFDGVCDLCNNFVRFVIENDKNSMFYFSSLQSTIGVELLNKFNINPYNIDSIVLVESDKAYVKSTAILKIAENLGPFYFLLSYFKILPKFFRDWIYDFVAKNRYQWFGKKDVCIIPNKELQDRFLTRRIDTKTDFI